MFMSNPINSEFLIQLTNIEKVYHNKRVLGPISLELKKKKAIAVIGPSGCGKSTLLGILAGTIQPSRGQFSINGKSILHLKDKEHSHFPLLYL